MPLRYALNIFAVTVCCTVFLSSQKIVPHRTSKVQSYGWNNFNGNTVNAVISNAGTFSDYKKNNSAGIEWPLGSKKFSVYTAGLWVAGKHRPTNVLRTAAMYYDTEFQPGKILGTFNTTTNSSSVADDPAKSIYRLYKVNKGDAPGSGNIDYEQWPVHLGAPFTDKNGNGMWDKGVDDPVKWGDQQLWCVANDLDHSRHFTIGKTPPMGIELQATFIGYDRPGVFANSVIMRYKIINKSDADYDSVYVSHWDDSDLGNSGDDYSASDSMLSMIYTFNGNNIDFGESGYGTKPPSGGFVLLQGPRIMTNNSADTALYEGKKYSGQKNLPPSSIIPYVDNPEYSEPSVGINWPKFASQIYNNMRGFGGNTGMPIINPQTKTSTRFAFPGDPVANNGEGSGWTILSMAALPGDAKGSISTGPFTLAKGDTQEVVWAYVIAQDTDRLSSIVKLRQYVSNLHKYFRENFSEQVMPRYAGAKVHMPEQSVAWKKRQIYLHDTLPLIIANHGSDTLQLQIDPPANAAFTVASSSGSSIKLPLERSVSLKLMFKPEQTISYSDTLVIRTNDSTRLQVRIPLSGEGVDIVPAKPGTVYAVETRNLLYTINSFNGAATLSSNLAFMPQSIFIHPVTKELMAFVPSATRLSTTNATFAEYAGLPALPASFLKGLAYYSDTAIYFGGNSFIGRIRTEGTKVDTAIVLPAGWRVNGLARNPITGNLWFSLTQNVYTGDTSNAVYSADLAARTFRRIGKTNFGKRMNEIAFDPAGRLYGLADTSASTISYLIRIDTSTGAATVIGPTGVKNLRSMAFDPQSVLGVTIQNNTIPARYSLSQNYPNPFNPSTAIEYSVPALAHVRLSVYDLLGKEVMNLVNEQRAAGNYSVSMDASRLASGIYMYRMTSGNFVETKKMVILK